MAVVKRELSGGADGVPIKVAATSTPGTTIHTATSATADGNYDEIWLYAVNSSASDVKLTIEFGGATAPDYNIESTIAAESGLVLIVPGLILQNSKTVKAFAGTADVICLSGFVNRITES